MSCILARPAGLEPATVGLAYQLPLSRPCVAGLWSGLSLHRLRCRTYSLYGSLRKLNRRFPRDCHQHYLLRFPRYSAVHCAGSVSRHRLLTQRPMLYPVELRALIISIFKTPQNVQNRAPEFAGTAGRGLCLMAKNGATPQGYPAGGIFVIHAKILIYGGR